MNNAPAIIAPTVGRKVWFRPGSLRATACGTMMVIDPNQPLDATVVYVHGERMVNLRVTDHVGWSFPIPSVMLLQPGETAPAGIFYCEWMPFQVGQAAKATKVTPGEVFGSELSARLVSVANAAAAGGGK